CNLYIDEFLLEGNHIGINKTTLKGNHANINADILEESLVKPSQLPNDKLNCFNRRGLHFIHINARSMLHKLSEIKLLAMKIKPAVISITETWLDICQPDGSLHIEGYNLLRRDRLTHGGGVCAYVRADLAYNPKVELQNVELEDLWFEILLPLSKPIFVGTCYRAPYNNKIIECLESTMSKLRSDCDTIILGDFNICMLNDNSSLRNRYIELLDTHNFTQLINSPTRVTQSSATIIDHIHTNNQEKICQSGIIESGISDHYITYCTRKVIKCQINKHNPIKIRSMKNYSNDIFVEKLQSLDWSVVTKCIVDVNEAWENSKHYLLLLWMRLRRKKKLELNVEQNLG
ncbi:unnamed protein product, partial [Meganyctiphanes norvegica]